MKPSMPFQPSVSPSSNDRIIRWIHSVDENKNNSPENWDEPPTKRLKLTHREYSDMSMSGHLTPPNTVMGGEKPVAVRKRGNDEVEGESEIEGDTYNAVDEQRTPRPRRPDIRFIPPPPTKRTASPVKVPDQLQHLETPVHHQPLTKKDFENNPCLKDVEGLYSKIKRAMLLRQIIPAEVRDDIESLDQESEPEDDLAQAAYERRFCEPVTDVTAQVRLRATFEMLLGIQQQAEDCKQLSRHEGGWNNLVHSPLLSHVFRDRRRRLQTEKHSSAVGTRLEPAMHATIQADSIPVIRQARKDPVGNEDIAEVYALSIEGSQTSRSSADPGTAAPVHSQGSVNVNLATTHSRSDDKRVDYVVVIDTFEPETGLKERIEEINLYIWSQHKAPYHINQTAYKPVADSPIALSIETKKALSSDEPLLQLGIWVAAWYKRMSYIRQLLVAFVAAETDFRRRLISVPLIQVVGHEWDIYFACFADNITLYGPVRMGSTASLVQLYALVASLEAVKTWIRTAFKKGMEEWFICSLRSDDVI